MIAFLVFKFLVLVLFLRVLQHDELTKIDLLTMHMMASGLPGN